MAVRDGRRMRSPLRHILRDVLRRRKGSQRRSVAARLLVHRHGVSARRKILGLRRFTLNMARHERRSHARILARAVARIFLFELAGASVTSSQLRLYALHPMFIS